MNNPYKVKDLFKLFGIQISETIFTRKGNTKGHKHFDKSKEIYICIKGRGMLVLKNSNNLEYVKYMHPSRILIVPKDTAHKVYNITNDTLKFICIYKSTAGHDYNVNWCSR